MINLEVKGTLAKLLATEDLVVEHRPVSTASFNVQTRVLTLPRWENASNSVFDLLIAHEVGHALFTPNEDWSKTLQCPKVYLNVTEDARIETMMKRKFGGLPKTFHSGYKKLHEDDFFELGDRDVNEMGVADRANLYFKLGHILPIKFNETEQVVIDQIASAVTFEEACEAAEALYKLVQDQQDDDQEDAEQEAPESVEERQESGGDDEGNEQDEESPDEDMSPDMEPQKSKQGDGEEKDEEERPETSQEPQGGGDFSSGDRVETVENLEEKLKDLANMSSWQVPQYLERPEEDMTKLVISNKEIHEYLEDSWRSHRERLGEYDPDMVNLYYGDFFTEYDSFKREIQSEVNYMVKEFECKKSAAAYSRATTSRTGVLDCTKLHTYKYNEDLFKKVTSLPEGKNHGLVFVLDWSGSMCNILQDTIKQLLSLVMFCDKVNIPFDVYAFTNEWNDYDYYEDSSTDGVAGEVFIGSQFAMLNLLTSRVSRKVLLQQLKNVYVMGAMYKKGTGNIPSKLTLSGTPLNEALLSLYDIIPEFKNRTGAEKVHAMVLTDGEANMSRYYRDDSNGGTYIGRLGSTDAIYYRNRKNGTTRKLERGFTVGLVEDLCDSFPNSTFTGFRIAERGSSWYVRQVLGYNNEEQLAAWKKDRNVMVTNYGYTKYYIVADSAINQSTDFEVDDDASKAKIKSAFSKSLKGKKNNKKILGDFITMIA